MGCFSFKTLRRRYRQRHSNGTGNNNNSSNTGNSASISTNPGTYAPVSDKAKLVGELLPESSQRRPIPAEQDKLGNLGCRSSTLYQDFHKPRKQSAEQGSLGTSAGDPRIPPPIAHQINNERTRFLALNLSKSTAHQTPLNKQEPASGSTAAIEYVQSESENIHEESAGQESLETNTSVLQIVPPIAHQVDNGTAPPALDLSFTGYTTSGPSQLTVSANIAAAKDGQTPELSARSEHFKKFEMALKKRLKDDELQVIFSPDYSGPFEKPSDIVYNVVESLRLMVEKKPADKNKKFLVFLDKAAKIGDVAIQHHPDVVALVWASFRLLLQVAVDELELKELVGDTTEIVARALETCGFYEEIYILSRNNLKLIARLGDAIAELYATVVVFSVKAEKHMKKSNIGQSLKRTLIATNTELQSLAGEIEAKERVLYNFASMVNTEDQQRRLEELCSVVKEIENSQKRTLEEKQEETLRQCRIWLGGLSIDLGYEKNRELHVAGTCQWVLDSEPFKAWMIGEVDILLVHGIPGAGKSVLQSFILERLKELRSKNPLSHGPILYFFFKNGNSTTESAITMMATLIDQLIQQHQNAQFVELLNAARIKSNTQRCEDLIQLWDLFIKLVNAYGKQSPRISVLLDALDECGNRKKFLQYIASPLDWKALGIKFLLTSRPEDDIMEALILNNNSDQYSTRRTTRTIKLLGEQVNRDIIHFVEDQITRKYHRLQPFKEQIVETVPKKAQGMFRYAALVLEELVNPSTKDVEETLDSIPPGLYNIYIWILEHLSDKDLLLRKTVFTWVALAFRPITVYEIALAFAACDHDRSKTEFDPAKKILVDEQQISRACGPLVEVTPEDTIAFTHFSVKEFLLAKECNKEDPYDSTSPLVVECLILNARIGHAIILKTCMAQLLSNVFLKSSTRKSYMYSIRYWFEHAGHSSNLDDEIGPWPAVSEFLSTSNQYFSSWLGCFPSTMWDLFDTPIFHFHGQNPQATPIHVMAAFGLLIPLKKAIKSSDSDLKIKLSIHDSNGISPLSYAVRRRQIEAVKLLLESGAKVDNEDRWQKTPLSYAAEKGYTEIPKLLLEKGANIDSKDCYERTPLSYAAGGGYIEITKLLLERGANIDSKDRDQMTPLSYAASKGNTETMKLLIERGADIESKSKYQRTLLSYAAGSSRNTYQRTLLSYAAGSSRNTEEVVQLLLERGVDINSKDNNQRTPLSYAAENGNTDTVKLLLENGADIDTKDCGQRTLLSYAAERNNLDTVKLLVERGADIDSKDSEQRTLLSYAATGGNAEIVKLFLECGADIDSKDSNQRTPLSYAADSYRDTEEVVKLLLESGANVDSKDSDQRTPLSYAAGSYRNAKEVVKLLLESGADIKSKDSSQRIPLSHATEQGHNEITKLLLESSADIDSKDSNQRTPLSYAAGSYQDPKEVVQLLLVRGVDINSKDSNQRTPLSYAAENWNTETVKLLLENGADIDTKDCGQRTLLSYAAQKNNPDTVKLLVERGVDIDSKDSNQRTPLSYAAGSYPDSKEVVQLLLVRGVDINSKDSNQRTPLSYAAEKGNAVTAKLLLERGADIDSNDSNGRTPLSYAVESHEAETAKLLVERGADINSKDNEQRTALFYGVLHWVNFAPYLVEADKTLKLLLEGGDGINIQDENQMTPLSYAAMVGNTGSVKLLIESGATIDSKDIDHITPLSLAAGNGNTEVVRLLLERGAELEATDKDGRTPLEWARIGGHKEVVELLSEYKKLVELRKE